MKQAVKKTQPSRSRRTPRVPDRAYQALIEVFPLRPLRSERDYDAAVSVLDTLAMRPEGSLARGERDYFDTLTLLVENYDSEHYDLESQPRDPISMLRYVMEESGMSQAKLGQLLGNRALASLILNGHRQLSKSHIRTLAEHFKVSSALFLDGNITPGRQGAK